MTFKNEYLREQTTYGLVVFPKFMGGNVIVDASSGQVWKVDRQKADANCILGLTLFVTRRASGIRPLLRSICRSDFIRHDISALVAFGQRVRHVARCSSRLMSHGAP